MGGEAYAGGEVKSESGKWNAYGKDGSLVRELRLRFADQKNVDSKFVPAPPTAIPLSTFTFHFFSPHLTHATPCATFAA